MLEAPWWADRLQSSEPRPILIDKWLEIDRRGDRDEACLPIEPFHRRRLHQQRPVAKFTLYLPEATPSFPPYCVFWQELRSGIIHRASSRASCNKRYIAGVAGIIYILCVDLSQLKGTYSTYRHEISLSGKYRTSTWLPHMQRHACVRLYFVYFILIGLFENILFRFVFHVIRRDFNEIHTIVR